MSTCSSFPSEEVTWAKTVKGVPAEGKCLQCASVWAKSYPHLPWDSCRLMYNTTPTFKREFTSAARLLAGEKSRDFVLAEFAVKSGLELVLERPFLVHTEASFKNVYGIEAKDCSGIALDSLPNERGEMMKVVIMEDSSGTSPMRLYARSIIAQTEKTDIVQPAPEALRKEQANDVMQWYQKDMVKQRPQGLTRTMSVAEIQRMVELAKKEAERKAAEPAEEPTENQEDATAEATEELAEESEPEEENALEAFAVPRLPSEMAKEEKQRKKGEKGGKGGKRGGRKGSKSGKGRAPVPSVPSQSALSADSSSHSAADLDESMSVVSRKRGLSPQSQAAESTTRRRVSGKSSVAGGSGPSAVPWLRLVENASKYMEQLDLRLALEGKLNGHALNQSLRILEAMQKTKPYAPEVVQLRAKRNAVATAVKITAEKLGTVSEEVLQESLGEVMPQMDCELPMNWKVGLLTRTVTDLALSLDSIEDVKLWCSAVVPVGSCASSR
eukprot:6443539-Amphidinium_carterae.2